MKTVRRTAVATLLAIAAAACGPAHHGSATGLPDPVVASVEAAVDNGHRVGIVVGLVNRHGTFVHGHGNRIAGSLTPVGGDTRFALGSVSKLFAVELLARLTQQGVVALETPLRQIWPALEDASQTRLHHLATHRAALPRALPAAAFASGQPDALLALLAQPRTLPATASYSNAGMALLGLSLAQAAEADYADLLRWHVLAPAGMTDSGFHADTGELAFPHRNGEDITHQRPATAAVARGAGGLYSTADDLLAWLETLLWPRTSTDRERNRLLFGDPRKGAVLGWKVHRDGDLEVYHHGGDANGYQAFVGLRPDIGVGVVLLSNSSADDDLQQIALHLLDLRVDLPAFDRAPSLSLDPGQLRRYRGRYRLEAEPEGNVFELQVEESRLLFVEHGPDGRLVRRSPLFAVEPDVFELREIPVRLRFPPGPSAPASATLLVGDDPHVLLRVQAAAPR